MGATLVELEQALRSQKEKMTVQEENILLKCKSKAMKGFTSGLSLGAVVAMAALLPVWFCNPTSFAGTSAFFGLWRLNRSMDSCQEHILSLEGTRMQMELAKILVNNHANEPWAMQLLNRHFYLEKVFDDSNSDKPLIRFRYRNFFGDIAAQGGRANNDSYEVSSEDSDTTNVNEGLKQFPMNPVADSTEDPLDGIFGFMAPVEEIHHPVRTSKSGRVITRRDKKSHRRHRVHRHEALN
ncbi:hypothetical protein Tsubulata_019940 [Turnera subulata]|uniref:Uncharacterized protein n=1 Tax=Turnera subulata TaxID=218843 RepID=A0A9Q0FGW8_9ROSI|nr:hypothetical protein Tsubulata_019940 [Turnera subulata]